jgi:phosphoenolpyruvate synthase/pyruvate phosphate dikinase
MVITVSCAEGDTGVVYDGALDFQAESASGDGADQVEQGIDSISLNPDAVLQTLLAIAAMEQPLRVTGAHRPA